MFKKSSLGKGFQARLYLNFAQHAILAAQHSILAAEHSILAATHTILTAQYSILAAPIYASGMSTTPPTADKWPGAASERQLVHNTLGESGLTRIPCRDYTRMVGKR